MLLGWVVSAIVATFGPQGFAAEPDSAFTLERCYEAAVRKNESVGIERENYVQAKETYRQAIGSILPHVTASGQQTAQNPGAFGGTPQSNIRLSLSQPIFQGFREYAGLAQSRDLVRAENFQRSVVNLSLFTDVAQSFYNTMSLEQDLRDIESELGLYAKWVKELELRIKIGRSRQSEVLTVQTAMKSLEAQMAQDRGLIQASREVLAFQTGLSRDLVLRDPDLNPPAPGPLDSYLSLLEKRPDVQVDKDKLGAAEQNVAVARGGHLPTIDLSADFYPLRIGGFPNQSAWDAVAGISVPIFTGGVIQSGVRQAASKQVQAELSLSQTRRQAEESIRSSYAIYLADQGQLASLRDAAKFAERNYAVQSKEYRLGLVANIDVLQALSSFQENQRAFDRQRFNTKLDYYRLEASVARWPAPALAE